jgi:S1-C subfamily serine protease
MSETGKCGRCGVEVAFGAPECDHCKGRSTPVSLRSGGVLARIAAGIFDLLVLGSLIAGLLLLKMGLLSILVAWVLIFEVGYRLKGSLGKALFGLSTEVDGRLRFFLRESLGKFASLAMFGIGFLLIFSSEGLALHDLIVGSRVVQRNRTYPVSHAFRIALLLVAVGVVAFTGAKLGSPRKLLDSQILPQVGSLDLITQQIPAVLTVYCYDRKDKIIAQGSGFVISAGGVGVTNFHVLETAYRAEAELGDGRRYHVLRVKSFDRDKDVVVLPLGRMIGGTIEWPDGLPFLRLGSSQTIAVGDRIATIGSPEGLTNSVTDGLISAIRRDEGINLLQITAPISPGSSGGPVFDLRGKVIGITVAQLREGQNLNFAIPIETVEEVAKQDQKLEFDEFRILVSLLDGSQSGAEKEHKSVSAKVGRSQGIETANVAGTYWGRVHNQTVDQSADFGIMVRNDASNLEGCMGVVQPLIGSGLLRGRVNGSTITFVVDDGGLNLFFHGNATGGQISGNYTVSPVEGVVQAGDFYLEKANSKEPQPGSFNCPTDAEMNQK